MGDDHNAHPTLRLVTTADTGPDVGRTFLMALSDVLDAPRASLRRSREFSSLSLWVSITTRQFKQMQERLAVGPRRARPVLEPTASRNLAQAQVILGLDPSLRGTGYGVIRLAKPFPHTLAHGTISCPTQWEHSRCLARIVRDLREVLRQYHPTICVVEGLFYAQNLQTALIMGEARGAALATIADEGLEIYELAPRKVKQAMVGYGGAQKHAVAKMVQRLLNLASPPAPDAADALALALAHAHEQGHYPLNPPKRV